MQQVIAHTANLKHRTMIQTTYAAGLRLNEVLHLRIADIDSARMTIRVEQGKGSRPYTVLSPHLLETLRGYWKAVRPVAPWLFPRRAGRNPGRPVGTATRLSDRQTAGRAYEARGHSRPPPRVRHAPARSGVDLHTIQRLLGHGHISTTTRYLQLTRHTEMSAGSPLDLLARFTPSPQS